MPQQTDAAVRVRLHTIDDTLDGQKLRVAGRVLAYDAGTGLALLVGGRGRGALVVDARLCVGAWAGERLAVVTAVGHLERCTEPVCVPAGRGGGGVVVDARRVLRAVLVVETGDLDLDLWDAVVGEEEETRGDI